MSGASAGLGTADASIVICPGTTMHDDYAHRPFVSTNEEDHSAVIAQLRKLPALGNTVVGVSCFAILNIAAARPIPADELSIVVIDRGTRVVDFWEKVCPVILESGDAEDFLDRFMELYSENKDVWAKDLPDHLSYSAHLDALGREVFRRKISWLSSDETFTKIQTIVAGKRLTVFGGDITKKEDMDFVHSELAKTGRKVDTLYCSNCHEYMRTTAAKLSGYASSVGKLLDPSGSLVVTTAPRTRGDEKLCQRLISPKSEADLSSFWGLETVADEEAAAGGGTVGVSGNQCFYFDSIAKTSAS